MVRTTLLDRGTVPVSELTYVVMGARYSDRWVFVRHRDRTSWEMPAGHIEEGEEPEKAARRELFEETGTTGSTLFHVCDYLVENGDQREYGRLYVAGIEAMEAPLEYEIAEVRLLSALPENLTYPEVQSVLFDRSVRFFRG